MDVPTGILISFGDEEEGNVAIKPHEEPIAPPRRSRKGRSVRGSAVTTSTTQQQQASTNVEQLKHQDSKAKGAEVNLRGTKTAKSSPPDRPTSPPKRPQSMPVPVGPLVDFSNSSSEASEVMKSEMVEEQTHEEVIDIGSPADKLKRPVSILFIKAKKKRKKANHCINFLCLLTLWSSQSSGKIERVDGSTDYGAHRMCGSSFTFCSDPELYKDE